MEYRRRRRQRARRDSGICVAIAVTLLVSLASITVAPAAALGNECWDAALSDLDGGGPDVIVGLPSYDLPGMPDAGALLVFSNMMEERKADLLPPADVTLLTAADISGLQSQGGGRFGSSVVVWRDTAFDDDDHCADLLVGAPGQNVDGVSAAGEVYLIRGTNSGPEEVKSIFNEANLAGTGGAQTGAGFGSSLAAETMQTIAIGVPHRDVGVVVDAGRIVRVDYLNSRDPTTTIIEQGDAGVDRPDPEDQFGEVVDLVPSAAGPALLVGVPHEDVGSHPDAGAVVLARRGGTLSMVTQDSSGAGGIAEPGDQYGAALDGFSTVSDHPVGMVAIGVPGEDLAGAADAGTLSYATFELTAGPDQKAPAVNGLARTMAQGMPGVPDIAEAGDQFGATVLVDEFDHGKGLIDLVVGAPLEDLSGIADAGVVSITPIRRDGSFDRGRRPAWWTGNATSGGPRAGDQFGATLSSIELSTPIDSQDLELLAAIMTVPGKDIGMMADAGMAYLGSSPGGSLPLTATIGQIGAGRGMVPMKMG